ncbi:hypothetical protein MYXO_02984 [Myxococcaceae bacterium]|jgi:hypothetical protein|nr:hypothetical protein MYXO_02984 [Myxococcaceae bacterium]
MSEKDPRVMTDRRRSLEEEFFAKQNAKLKEQLREKLDRERGRAELQAAYPQVAPAMIEHLIDHGFDAEAAAALWLVPLVLVAWADGSLADAEREAILRAAAEHGIPKGSKGYDRLAEWIVSDPSDHLEELWLGFVRAACAGLSANEVEQMRDGVLRLASEVAGAAGGFLGLGTKISQSEQAVLDRVAAAFSR